MSIGIEQEVAAMAQMSIGELRETYERVFGEPTTCRHAQSLIRRIAWRLQANQLGGLSERARQRALAMADEADLRLTAPKDTAVAEALQTITQPAPEEVIDDAPDLVPGAVLERRYKGQLITVTVMENGFRYEGGFYRSLSAVAKKVTGSHWNGKAFFGLKRRKQP